jgi:hypothetical protein
MGVQIAPTSQVIEVSTAIKSTLSEFLSARRQSQPDNFEAEEPGKGFAGAPHAQGDEETGQREINNRVPPTEEHAMEVLRSDWRVSARGQPQSRW